MLIKTPVKMNNKILVIGLILLAIASCTKNGENDPDIISSEKEIVKTVNIKTYPYKFGELYYSPDITQDFEYDKNGNIVSDKYKSDRYENSHTYVYENQLLIELKHYSFYSLLSRFVYEYDGSGKCQKISEYLSNGLYKTYTREYDEKGLLKKETEVYVGSGSNYSTLFYKDSQQRDTLIIHYMSNSENYRMRYSYDFNGNMLTDDFIENGISKNQATRTYTYDNNNRVLQKTITNNPKAVFVLNGKYYKQLDYYYLENDSIDYIDVKESISKYNPLESTQKIKYTYTYY